MHVPRLIGTAMLAVAVSLSALPAFADPASESLKAKMFAAWQDVKSFKMTVATPEGGAMTGIMVLPDKTAFNIAMHGMAVKAVRIGEDMYMQMNGGPWSKVSSAMAGQMSSMMKVRDLKSFKDQAVLKVLPDEQFDGKTVGAFQSENAAGQKSSGSSVCNYDKSTYRLVRCHTDTTSIVVSDYNSSTNVVDVPK